jgi:hypothetical protein
MRLTAAVLFPRLQSFTRLALASSALYRCSHRCVRASVSSLASTSPASAVHTTARDALRAALEEVAAVHASADAAYLECEPDLRGPPAEFRLRCVSTDDDDDDCYHVVATTRRLSRS